MLLLTHRFFTYARMLNECARAHIILENQLYFLVVRVKNNEKTDEMFESKTNFCVGVIVLYVPGRTKG